MPTHLYCLGNLLWVQMAGVWIFKHFYPTLATLWGQVLVNSFAYFVDVLHMPHPFPSPPPGREHDPVGGCRVVVFQAEAMGRPIMLVPRFEPSNGPNGSLVSFLGEPPPDNLFGGLRRKPKGTPQLSWGLAPKK